MTQPMGATPGVDGTEAEAEAEAEAEEKDAMWKVALASAIGNTIENYDFTLYATATALVFNKIFFPSTDPLVGSLAAFVTFFMGYCARPFGGILFGHFGDRIGRKVALMTTIAIMGLGTFLIGCMPTYDSIGIWAPIGLVLLRLAQGIGIGGEYGGGMVMTVEHAPPEKRGFYQLSRPCRGSGRFGNSGPPAWRCLQHDERCGFSLLGMAPAVLV